MNKKAWIIFAAVCIVLIGGLVYLSNKNRVNVSDVKTSEVLAASEASGGIGDHVFGKADSKVVLIEYGDFQCPGCGAAHPVIKELSEKYKDQIAFVFRNFPITSIHPNAKAAAAAAEAAGLQGKYWEMHNKLFESQNQWSNISSSERVDFFTGYANDLGLDVEKFKADMTSTRVSQKINFDKALGVEKGVNSTPSFYLNGQAIEDYHTPTGAIDKAKFEQYIIDELKAQGIEPSVK